MTSVSLRARLVMALAARMVDDRSTPEAFHQGIEKNRAQGPGQPKERALKGLRFGEDQLGVDRVQVLEPHDGSSRLRLLYLHGGAYVNEIQPMQWGIGVGLTRRLGARLVAPIYPLAPEQGWEDGLSSVRRVYAALAEEVGAENVIVFGDSAGGGLALVLAQQLRDAGERLPAALALFSPWLDVSLSGADQPALEERDPLLTIAFLRQAGALWAGDLPLDDPRVSPLFGTHRGLPPTIVFSGDRDVLDSDALRLAERNPHIVHRHYPGMMHVWAAAPIPEGKRALDEAAAFISEHLVGAGAV